MCPPDSRLRNYCSDGRFWSAVGFVPFWGGDLPIWFYTYAKEPTPRQIRIARAILDYPHNLRGVVENGVFDYYQTHVFGAIDFGDPVVEKECAPCLTEPGQVWRLIPGAETLSRGQVSGLADRGVRWRSELSRAEPGATSDRRGMEVIRDVQPPSPAGK